jgi:hypothetical protein
MVLGSLLMLSGIGGIPFADDIDDVLDTIAQRVLGVPATSVREMYTKYLDSLLPGLGTVAKTGLFQQYSPWSFSDRVALGNMIPGTDMFKYGTDASRSLIEMGGPVASFLQFSGKSLSKAFGNKTDMSDVLRASPVTMGKAVGDIWQYLNSGAITDGRGYVVSRDLTAAIILGRVLGFYPEAAKAQNRIVGVVTAAADYRNGIATEFKEAYAKARQAGDGDAMNAIREQVSLWNATSDAWGSGLRINFGNILKGAVEAERTTGQRLLKAASSNQKPVVRELLDTVR